MPISVSLRDLSPEGDHLLSATNWLIAAELVFVQINDYLQLFFLGIVNRLIESGKKRGGKRVAPIHAFERVDIEPHRVETCNSDR